MTARRRARAARGAGPVLPHPAVADGTPAAVRVGCLVEVWAAKITGAWPSHLTEADRLFEVARIRYAAVDRMLNPPPAGEQRDLPDAWSLDGSEQSGLRLREMEHDVVNVDQRLAAAGVTRADIPALRAQAEDLYAETLGTGSLRRAYERARTRTEGDPQ